MFSLPVRICIVATAVTYGIYKLSAGDQSAFLVLIAAEVAKDLPTAEEQMRLAVNGALRTSNDRCIATALLAHFVAQNNGWEQALPLLEEAEQIPHRDGTQDYLKQLRDEFESAS